MGVTAWKPGRNSVIATIILLVCAAVWAAAAPPAAKAAPPSNIWDLTALQTHLNSGPVQGYFLTVLGGSTEADQAPVAIPATIESIVPGETQDGGLILFSATGSTITDIGGIAAGMSGSPLYAGDPDHPHPVTDPLIGAVSYGDIFTTDGLGLATPIEYMIAVQTNNPASRTARTPAAHAESVALAKPVTTSSVTVKRVVVAASAGKARTMQASSGAPVFAPLDVVEIGGLSAQSRLFKKTAAKLEAAGYQVEAGPDATAVGNYDPAWSTPLVAGGSVGTLYSVGDLWIGAAGTVTYVDGTTVMAYGHPLDWLGSTVAYLTNAWVSGIWHTTYEPYKLMAPAATQGTITQDRNSGVEGVVGTLPAETAVSAAATFAGKTVTSTTQVPQQVVSGSFYNEFGAFLPTFAAQVPIYKVIDAALLAGSATTTSTVVVNDGTQDYTVTINNLWDDPADVTYEATNDIDNILYTLTNNADGIAPVTVKSVDFAANLSSQRNETRIVAAQVPGGLKIGPNDVTVTLAQYGVAALQTTHVTLTLPPGTTLGGGIEVYGPGYGNGDYYDFGPMASSAGVHASAVSDDRQSVADLVASLQAAPTNNDILVDYLGNNGPSPFSSSLEGVGATTAFVNGDISLSADQMMLAAQHRVVKRHASARLFGMIMNVDGPTTVSLYGKRAGATTRTLLAVVPVSMTTDGTGLFTYTRKNLKKSIRFTAIWDGDNDHLGATASTYVRVK
jgi:hypothetical protein